LHLAEIYDMHFELLV